MSDERMLPKMVRMVVSASLPDTSGSRSCTSASTNSSMTPDFSEVVSKAKLVRLPSRSLTMMGAEGSL